MLYLVKHFLDGFTNPPDDLTKLLSDNSYRVLQKGFGTPTLEIKYLHQIFLHIQAAHPKFESFSWGQSNCYNDNYYHFDLVYFTVNETICVHSDFDFSFHYDAEQTVHSKIHLSSTLYPDPGERAYMEELNLEMGKRGLVEPHLSNYWKKFSRDNKHLELPCLKFLCILKFLEIRFGMYYFLYCFGNGVEVFFNKEGVMVQNKAEDEYDGHPLGIGMDLMDE